MFRVGVAENTDSRYRRQSHLYQPPLFARRSNSLRDGDDFAFCSEGVGHVDCNLLSYGEGDRCRYLACDGSGGWGFDP
jgi:hypothetical protein